MTNNNDSSGSGAYQIQAQTDGLATGQQTNDLIRGQEGHAIKPVVNRADVDRPRSHAVLRWPLIRHIRAAIYCYRYAYRATRLYGPMSIEQVDDLCPNEAAQFEAIFRGDA